MTRRGMVIAGAASIVAAVLLGVLVMQVAQGLPNIDAAWNAWMGEIRTPALFAFAFVLDAIGGGWVATFLVPLALAAVLLWLRGWRVAVFALAAFAGSALLVQLLKQLFARARPEDLLVASDFGSFPSGHTANAATIAVVLWLFFPRWISALLGVLWVLAMAFSRTLLSVHWLSDTLGGALAGIAAAFLLAAALSPWVLARRGSARESPAVHPASPGAEEA